MELNLLITGHSVLLPCQQGLVPVYTKGLEQNQTQLSLSCSTRDRSQTTVAFNWSVRHNEDVSIVQPKRSGYGLR